MDPFQLVGLTGPANNFAMGGVPMHLANVLISEGKPVPSILFLDIMVKKTQILIHHVKDHHLGICLMANIGKHTANIWLYDNFADVNTQLLHITISNLPNLETQLFQLYVEVTGILHEFMPTDLDNMPSLEDITDEES